MREVDIAVIAWNDQSMGGGEVCEMRQQVDLDLQKSVDMSARLSRMEERTTYIWAS